MICYMFCNSLNEINIVFEVGISLSMNTRVRCDLIKLTPLNFEITLEYSLSLQLLLYEVWII